MKRNFLPILFLVAVVLIGRLMPHPPNFAPVAAVSIIAALYIHHRYSFLVPLVGMLVSDFVIGFYSSPIMATVYGCILITYFFGRFVRKDKNAMTLLATALGSSVLFFLTTNAAVWLFGSMYPHTAAGLYTCYIMAIPFFKNTLAGDLFYLSILVGVFELSRISLSKTQKIVLLAKNQAD